MDVPGANPLRRVVCVDEAFFFVQCASIAKLVGNLRQHATQNLIAAPSLKAPMHGFVVRVALRQHVTLEVVYFDEEPDEGIYSEGLTRTNETGGIVYLCFTMADAPGALPPLQTADTMRTYCGVSLACCRN